MIINKRKAITILSSLALAALFTACGKDKEPETVIEITPPVSANTEAVSENEQVDIKAETLGLVKSVIITYQTDRDINGASLGGLFTELNNLDPGKALLWQEVIEYWDYMTFEMKINDDGLPDGIDDDNSLCIVVLGYQLNDDGTVRDELIGRLEKALMCANEYSNAYILCTGGGTAPNAPDVTEAGAMGEWLIENGVDESRIIIEDDSLSTVDNALYSGDIIINSYPEINRVMIVTSDYHIGRGCLLFETVFLNSYINNNGREIHVISNCAYDTENGDEKMDSEFKIQANNLGYLAERIN